MVSRSCPCTCSRVAYPVGYGNLGTTETVEEKTASSLSLGANTDKTSYVRRNPRVIPWQAGTLTRNRVFRLTTLNSRFRTLDLRFWVTLPRTEVASRGLSPLTITRPQVMGLLGQVTFSPLLTRVSLCDRLMNALCILFLRRILFTGMLRQVFA